MTPEVHGLPEFYASAGGEVTARLVGARLRALWPTLPGQSVLGIGHAAPYLDLWRAEAQRVVALVPAHLRAAARRPTAGPATVAVAEEEALPFADRSFDRVLLVHGLEAAENARRLLREVWRVTCDEGRVIIVAPNRVGMWAHLERTPFGHGQPYSRGQLERLLARHLFRSERREAALFVPPYGLRFLRGTAAVVERAGRAMLPRFAGVVILEAEKDLFAAMPAGAVAVRRRMVVAEAA